MALSSHGFECTIPVTIAAHKVELDSKTTVEVGNHRQADRVTWQLQCDRAARRADRVTVAAAAAMHSVSAETGRLTAHLKK